MSTSGDLTGTLGINTSEQEGEGILDNTLLAHPS